MNKAGAAMLWRPPFASSARSGPDSKHRLLHKFPLKRCRPDSAPPLRRNGARAYHQGMVGRIIGTEEAEVKDLSIKMLLRYVGEERSMTEQMVVAG